MWFHLRAIATILKFQKKIIVVFSFFWNFFVSVIFGNKPCTAEKINVLASFLVAELNLFLHTRKKFADQKNANNFRNFLLFIYGSNGKIFHSGCLNKKSEIWFICSATNILHDSCLFGIFLFILKLHLTNYWARFRKFRFLCTGP